MTKDDYVIICGDFGGIWATDIIDAKETPEEKYALDWLENKPFTTLFIPGNHENYDRLTGFIDERLINCWLYKNLTPEGKQRLYQGYPKEPWHGGWVRKIRPSVMMLEHGFVFNIDDCKCFAFGGAHSHDISDGILKPYEYENKTQFQKVYKEWTLSRPMFRVHGTSWWPAEMPDQIMMDHGLKTATEAKAVDFVFTHDAPASAKILLGYDSDDLGKYFERIREVMTYKKWFFGHLHINKNLPDNMIAIYEEIVRIH